MTKRPTVSESSLAAVVVRWLDDMGADVYQEVEHKGSIADIVAVRGPELTVIETKTSWSLALVAQAMEWRRHAHKIYMAGPVSKTTWQVRQIAQDLGLGMLEVIVGDSNSEYRYAQPRVNELVASRRWNSRPLALHSKLRPEHKTAAPAGHAGGGRWTPYRDTCAQILAIVMASPGISVRDCIAKTKHHYATPASARTHIAGWVLAGRVPGVRLERDGRTPRLHPDPSVARRSW